MKLLLSSALFSALVLAGCVTPPQPTAEQTAAFENDMQSLAGELSDDAVQVGNSFFEVDVKNNRTVALVRPVLGTVTIETIEAAAAQSTGCQARAVENLYEYTGGGRNVSIARREQRKYGNQLPVMLSC